jgi:hypothetical protein
VLDQGLGCGVEDALEIVPLALVLDLDQQQLVAGVADLEIDPVVLVGGVLLVGLALQDLDDVDVVAQQLAQEAFQDAEVGLAAQQALQGPVEGDQAAGGLMPPLSQIRIG